MTRLTLIIMVLVTGFVPLLGQEGEDSFLVKEVLYEDYSYLGHEDRIASQRKVQYAYDAIGHLEHQVIWINSRPVVDPKWQKTHEYFFQYDLQGRETHYSSITYDYFGSGEGNYSILTIKRIYVDYYLSEVTYLSRNPAANTEDTKTIHFNRDGNKIYEYVSFISNDSKEEREEKWEYNDNGCLISKSFSTASYSFGQQTDHYKQKQEYTYTANCELLERKAFSFDENTETFILQVTTREEWERDASGNLIRWKRLTKNEGTDTEFEKVSELYKFYDAQNRDTLAIYNYYRYDTHQPYRQLYEHTSYTQEGKVVHEKNYEWLPADNLWAFIYESGIKYDHDENIISRHFRSKASEPTSDTFLIESQEEYEYNDNQQITYYYFKSTEWDKDPPLIREEVVRRDYNENQQMVYDYAKKITTQKGIPSVDESEDSIKYEFACDGRMSKTTRKSLINNGGSITTYTYFDIPECDLKNAPSSEYLVFPNPVQSALNIQFDGLPSEFQFQIYDMNGKLMHSRPYQRQNFFSLDVSHLRPGMYVLRIGTGDEQYLQKFTKI